MENPLTTTSILLHLNLKKWSGEVTDKKALQAVANAFNTDVRKDKYTKSLFVTDCLSEINLIAGRLRNLFYYYTRSWLDNGGGRLIPGRMFQEFSTKYTKLRHEYEQAVMEFIRNYEDHKAEAKSKKGDLYIESQYPPKESLKERFSVQLIALPFPDVDDFRIDAPQEALDELEQNMQQSMSQIEDTLTEEIRKRFTKRIAMLYKTLTVGKRFNKSLLEELATEIEFATHLQKSINKDFYEDMKKANRILAYEPEEIRNSQTVQDELIEICKELL